MVEFGSAQVFPTIGDDVSKPIRVTMIVGFIASYEFNIGELLF